MSLYNDLYKIIEAEMIERESTLPAQRQDQVIIKEAKKATKECLGPVFQAINDNWNG